MGILSFVIICLGLTFAACHAWAETMAQLSDQQRQVLAELNARNEKGEVLELDDDRMPNLLREGFTLAGAWAAAYLDQHPNPSAIELDHLFDHFGPQPRGVKSPYGDFLEYPEWSFAGGAVEVGRAVYAVRASFFRDNSTGAFIVVARNSEGHFQALWNIKDVAEKRYAQKDEIGRWLFLVRRAYYNGPLDVDRILRLSPTKRGNPRFLVLAHQSADGGTHIGQLSIWEWTGREAKPLLIDLYEHTDNLGSLRLHGQTIEITTKEELATMHSCGQCDLPRGIWKMRITPDGVEDLGHQISITELGWADNLFERFEAGKDTSDVASPDVVSALTNLSKVLNAELPAEAATQDAPGQYSLPWGMLGGCRVLRRGKAGEFELEIDDLNLRLHYIIRKGKPYFTALKTS